jgi:hypothetical protein
VGIFGLLAATAMVVDHIRHNVDEPEQPPEPAVTGAPR